MRFEFFSGLCLFFLTTSGLVGASATAPTSGLVPPGRFIWGINGHPPGGGGVYSDELGVTLEEQLLWVKKLGCDWYRFDVFARNPVPGVWEGKDELDAIVPAAKAAGVEMYPALYPPAEMRPYETLAERMKPEEIYQAAYDHAKAVTEKWGGQIKVWDLLNEPDGWTIRSADHSGLHRDDYDESRLVAAEMILKGQADGIRAGDPEAKISLNIGGWLHTGFVDYMVEKGLAFDILSWHWYSDCGSLEAVEKAGGYPLLAKLQEYGKPIWIGETNCRPGHLEGLDERRAWLQDFTESVFVRRSEGVEAIFYYELLDLPPGSGDDGYGFLPVERGPDETGQTRFRTVDPAPQFEMLQKMMKNFQISESATSGL